ncbi:MAG: DUF3352 domain-containing protein [Dehalococcoidia bacterium]|nr:DUF3352 domain-containing protein [Dehalococcoidia bacterium]MCZ7577224.1 DUF3352 domain-containing protein [Dehalococcoidia bacterium]
MPSVFRGPQGIIVTAAVAAAGALVAAAILFASGKASDVNLTTANLVPADAGVYIALNTDLSSGQWVSTFKLAEKLGADDPEGELKDGAEESGFDWEDDIAPFLGGNAAVYIRGLDVGAFSAQGAVILRAKSPGRVMEVLEEQAVVVDTREYGGVEYLRLGLYGYAARLGDHVVIAMDEASLEEVIDVYQGKAPALAGVEDFKKLRDELTGNFLGFVYLSTESLVGDFFLDDPVVRAALDQSGAGDMVFRPAAWVIGAKKGGFEFQAASIGESGSISPMLQPRESRFAALVPGETAIFFSTAGIAQTWQAVVDEAREAIDDAVRESSDYDSLDDALRDAGRELGIGSIEDLVALFEGETAVAAWFPSGKSGEPEVVLLAEVDEARARGVIEKVAASNATGPGEPRQAGGVEMTVFDDVNGDPLAYAFKDGALVMGTPGGVEAVLSMSAGQPSLARLNRYTATVQQMPSALGTYAFFNLGALFRLEEASEIPAVLGQAERALEGLIINAVDERGVVRLSGVLTIEE